MSQRPMWLSIHVDAWPMAIPRVQSPARALQIVGLWLSRHRETVWIAAILLIAGLAHGINMFHLPYYENDEGTYMSQAWSVVTEGKLAPYTYWYDHAPFGWIQIALWTMLTGGISSFGPTVDSGRVLMLAMQIGSTLMLYVIARRLSESVLVASIVALTFCLSAWGIYYHRRVLLDNICTFWMLCSLLLLLTPRLTLKHVWLSGLALGASVLSKEITIFVIPAMGYLLYHRAHRAQRHFAATTWFAIVLAFISLYALMAILKGELLPPGHGLFESPQAHTSLLGSLQYQAARGKDSGLLSGTSGFWTLMRHWSSSDPLLVVGGTVATLLCVALLPWRRTVGIMGLINLSLLAFLARGGEVLGFYLIPLLPLLALNVGLILGLCMQGASQAAARIARRPSRGERRAWLGSHAGLIAGLLVGAACLAGTAETYRSPELSFASNPTELWTSQQANAQVQAMQWVKKHIAPNKCIIVDDYLWTDMAGGENGLPAYSCVQWYWKVDLDPAIAGPVFHHRWQSVDYVIATGQMTHDLNIEPATLAIAYQAMQHSVVVRHFDTGGWPVDVRLVLKPGVHDPRAHLAPVTPITAQSPPHQAGPGR